MRLKAAVVVFACFWCLPACQWLERPEDPEQNVVTALVHEGRYGEALSAAEAWVRRVRTASSLRALGHALIVAGRADEAATAFKASLAMLETSVPPNVSQIADSLEGHASALIELAAYDQAERELTRSLRIRRGIDASDPASIARTLELRALALMRRGQYADARAPLDEAVEIRRRDEPHPDGAMTFATLGDLAWFEGRVSAAHDAYQMCLTLATQLLSPNHPNAAHCTRRRALMLLNLGDLSEARRLFEHATLIAERSLGIDHPEFAGYLNDLAESHRMLMDFRQARMLYEQALAVRERHLGRDHQRVATIVYNLALVSSDLGDLPEAQRQFSRAISIWERRMGGDHPFVALAKASLAQTLVKHGRYEEALTLQQEVLAVRERSLGPNHRDTADILGDLARTRLAERRITEADRLSARAISIWQRETPDSLGFAAALASRADVLIASRRPYEAYAHYTKALSITERVLGADHPNAADLRVKAAAMAWATNRSATALDDALAAEAAGRRFLLDTLRYLPEREATGYAVRRPSGLNLALTISVTTGSGVEQVFDAVAQSRALVFDEIASRRQADPSVDPSVAALRGAWISARQRLANLSVRSGPDTSPTQLNVLQETRREAERAERTLAERSAAFRMARAQRTVSLADIKSALPARTALVSYVRYERGVIPSYLAFIVSPVNPRVSLVPLGPAATIESQIADWRRETAAPPAVADSGQSAERALRVIGERLRQRIWSPLEAHLAGADRVFVVPDGGLHLMSLEALPTGTTDYLIERGPLLHYLTSERDVVTIGRQPRSTSRGLLAIGGAAFDASRSSPEPEHAGGAAGTRAACGSLDALRFAPLAATLSEVQDVVRAWRRTDSASDAVRLLVGAAATESAFKAQAAGHRVLHLATHGYFLGTDCVPAADRTRGVGGLLAEGGESRPPFADSPLLHAGLALAGANRRGTADANGDDGILTAEEVAGLRLDGVEWAVLSACDTGLGEVRGGEGVFGLRRAFQTAGARTVIMSLWQVDDQATHAWMRALYNGRLEKRLGTTEAVREASLAMMRERRVRGQSVHPFYWAAFIAAGDWR